MVQELTASLARVRARIEAACGRAGRDPSGVEILAVTKTHPLSVLQAALDAGLADLGESRVQEALPKVRALPQARIHLIGRLQSNKVNKAVGAFTSLQSVDRSEVLEKVARRAAALQIVQPVWIQVDIAQEEQKAGCPPEAAAELFERARSEPSLDPWGLMGLIRLEDDETAARRRFALLRRLAEALRRKDGGRARLSMGMSRDFEWAVLEGSDQVRLGSVLFGSRGRG